MSIKIPKVIKRKSTGGGATCQYYPITKRTGLKLFEIKIEAERCYAIHKVLADDSETAEYVPKVRSELVKVGKRWGYAVQTVKTWCDDTNINSLILVGLEHETYVDNMVKFLKFKAITEVCNSDNYKELFGTKKFVTTFVKWVFDDIHEGNVGMRDGKLIWIDFSMYDEYDE